MDIYQTRAGELSGTDFYEVRAAAMDVFRKIKRRSRRQPYVRSAYFRKDKIFLNVFWQHLFDKDNWRERMKRLKYFEAAIELLEHSRFKPESKINPNKRSEILHRFIGLSREGRAFYVQVKENSLSKKKFLIYFP